MQSCVIFTGHVGGGSGTRLLFRRFADAGHPVSLITSLREALSIMDTTGIFLPRFATNSYHEAAKVCDLFSAQNVTVAMTGSDILDSYDKFKTYKRFQKAKIATPDTWLVPEDADIIPSGANLPLILKPLNQSQGIGVCLVKTPDEYKCAARELWKNYGGGIAQTYIQAGGRDIRAFVVDGTVVAAMERIAPDGSITANIARGGRAHTCTLTPSDKKLAERASECFSSIYAGIDIIHDNTSSYVLEANLSPGFGIEKITGVPVSAMIITALMRKKAESKV